MRSRDLDGAAIPYGFWPSVGYAAIALTILTIIISLA